MTQAQSRPAPAPSARPVNRGPVGLLLAAALGFIFAVVMSWLLGIVVEIIGMYFIWPDKGVRHSESLVQETLDYIARHPRSVMVDDTVLFAQDVAEAAIKPFAAVGAMMFIKANSGPIPAGLSKMKHALLVFLKELARYVLIAMYVAQNIALRLSVVFFAVPLFVLLSLLAIVDGLVRRDLRKWSGGRESSFIYHHAKKLTKWGLTGGLGIYLAWPFGAVNPVYAVIALCVFAAWSLSLTVSSFKKYL